MWIRLRRATVCEVRIPRGASDALCGKPRVPAANQVRRDGPCGTLSPNEEGGLVARARATYLSEREKDFLHEKTLEVLEKVGVAYNMPQAIDLLASAAGAEVDRDALTAKHNLQAGSEGMLTGLACALAGADSMLAFGLMDGAETVSPAKVMMWTATSWG